ncbi:MAG: hypothetical protein ACYCUI_11580 [Vulcanimicrobiaceae bacterium]
MAHVSPQGGGALMFDFTSIIPASWRSSVMNLASQIENDVAGSWNAAISQLRSQVAAFQSAWAALTSPATAQTVAMHQHLSSQYQFLHATGRAIRAAIRGAQDVLGWFGLGMPILIPIAAIAIAIALITYWVDQAYVFNRKVAAIRGLVAQGVPPAEASSIVAQSAPQGVLSSLTSSLAPVGVLAGLALVALIAVPLLRPRR